ncbi:MAG TPA: glycosyltransferase family 39 protein [Solimonas sp.]|nr:glycosyltransferase family 39 protein [Solimonas sp.]
MLTRLARPWPLFLLAVAVALYRWWAWSQLDGLSLFSDEAQYWLWAQAPDWGYYSKPPMVAWLIWLSTHTLGSDAEWAIKAVPLLLYPFATFGVYALGRRLYDAETGRDAALLFLLMPALSLSAMLVTSDVPLLLFWTASLWFLWAALEGNAWRDWLLLGLCAGLGLMSKYSMAFFAFAALAFVLTHRQEYRLLLNPRLYAAATLALLVFLPNLLWNLRHDFVTVQHHAQISELDGPLIHPGAFFEFLGAQFGVFGPVSFGLLLLALARTPMWRKTPRPTRFLLAFCGAPLLLILGLAFLSHAEANWGAPLYVAASVLVAAHFRQQRRWLRAALLVNLLLALLLYHYIALLQATGLPLQRQYDAYRRLRGWDEVGYQVQRVMQEYGDTRLLTDERNLSAWLLYYARPLNQPRTWAPPGLPPQNHYQQTLPLQADDAGAFLWITKPPANTEVLVRFRQFERLPDIVVEPYPGLQRHYEAWRVEGFKGYDPGH